MNLLELPEHTLRDIGRFVCYKDLDSAIAWSGTHPDLREISVDEICTEWVRFGSTRKINVSHPFAGKAKRARLIDEEIDVMLDNCRYIMLEISVGDHRLIGWRAATSERIIYTRSVAVGHRVDELIMVCMLYMGSGPPTTLIRLRWCRPLNDVARDCTTVETLLDEIDRSVLCGAAEPYPRVQEFRDRIAEWRKFIRDVGECPIRRATKRRRGGF